MREREDKLSDAIARLKQEGQSQEMPKEVAAETLQRIADSGMWAAPIPNQLPAFAGMTPLPAKGRKVTPAQAGAAIRNIIRLGLKVGAVAAVFVLLGYTVGRLSASKPMSLEEIRETLTPSIAAAIEPALRKRVVEDIRHDYQLALAGTYVRVKEELTEQYRSDLNRIAIQTLAASNAVTNELLTQLVQSIDTAKAQDLRRIAQILSQIEMNRVRDRTQLASGLQTLAYHTEDELSRTKREVAQLLVDVRPASFDVRQADPRQPHDERNQP